MHAQLMCIAMDTLAKACSCQGQHTHMSANVQCLCMLTKHLHSKHEAVRVQQYYAGAQHMLLDGAPLTTGTAREAVPAENNPV